MNLFHKPNFSHFGIWNGKQNKWFDPNLSKDSEYVKLLDHIEGKNGFKKYIKDFF